jgi:two-component SAPR family response regulator
MLNYLSLPYQYMNSKGPVIVIEDDIEDQELFEEVFKKLDYPNKVMYFSDPEEALDFLNKTDIIPFSNIIGYQYA